MAYVDSKGMVRGTAGSVVYRSYRNKNIIQGKPRKFKQTQDSIKASTEFGVSSSSAAVIRRAFAPAYIHRDGKAASRTTQFVYRALRNSLSGTMGQRDLHDADLQELIGMNFNAEHPLNEVLKLRHQVSKDESGNIQVSLGAFDPSRDLRKAPGIPATATLFRIRLMLIAFDFRKEYLEYLDVVDLDILTGDTLAEQAITLQGTEEPGCMMLLSMSLLMYNKLQQTDEYVLINNKKFSPSALIAAFQAEEESDKTAEPIDINCESYPLRYEKMLGMGYAGNQLLRGLHNHLEKVQGKMDRTSPSKIPEQKSREITKLPGRGHKVSFKKQ